MLTVGLRAAKSRSQPLNSSSTELAFVLLEYSLGTWGARVLGMGDYLMGTLARSWLSLQVVDTAMVAGKQAYKVEEELS